MIDFNELRLVRNYKSWDLVLCKFNLFVQWEWRKNVHYETPEDAWAAFLKQEDEDGEA